MRILWISHSGELGGAELSLAEGAEALVERGHEVRVVVPEDGPLRERLRGVAQIDVSWHNRWMTQPGESWSNRIGWTAFNASIASRAIAEITREAKADVIISNSIIVSVGAFAALRARRPHVWFLHEYGSEDHGGTFHFGRRATLAFMRRANLFLVNSATLAEHFARWLPREKLRRVHYAVNVPLTDLSERRDARATCRLIFVGRRVASKGPQDAVAALGFLVSQGLDVDLELIGGSDRSFDDELRSIAASSGVEERLIFTQAHQDHFGRVAAADIGLMCSRSEAFGRVTIEAMKLGKPVVGAAGGATPELIRDGWNGYLYEPGNPRELARGVERLIRDPAVAREMGKRGQVWARKTFNHQTYGEELEQALESLAVRSPAG